MGEADRIQNVSLVGRNIRTGIDEFLAADFSTATINSGSVAASADAIISTSTSGLERVRLENVELFNNNANIVTVEFRDGQFGAAAAPRVLGPIEMKPNSGKRLVREDVIGRYANSGLFSVITSGPSSQGVNVTMSFVREALDYYE
jgi:hypothetical protein